jgi:hypothetical protein
MPRQDLPEEPTTREEIWLSSEDSDDLFVTYLNRQFYKKVCIELRKG